MQPSDDQRRVARDLVDAGFDLVVGGHSHVLNPAEVYRGRLIAYSLGDLIADFRPYQTRTGALLEVQVVRGRRGPPRVTGFTWYPTIAGRDGHRIRFARPGADAEAARALEFARARLGEVRLWDGP
jgi:poly-gamma-glutamate capsule biosynthesis protein CapA/YwtB (metallophosphatase superfamily)